MINFFARFNRFFHKRSAFIIADVLGIKERFLWVISGLGSYDIMSSKMWVYLKKARC